MFTIKQKMNELRATHGKATLTSFDDTNSSEVEIEVLTQDITRLFRKCEVRLQKFGDTASVSEADEKVSWDAAVFDHYNSLRALSQCTMWWGVLLYTSTLCQDARPLTVTLRLLHGVATQAKRSGKTTAGRHAVNRSAL